MKLPLGEPEADALRDELTRWDGFVSSALLMTEAVRACRRYGQRFARQAERGLNAVSLLPIDRAVLERAASLEPPTLRTLDALHLATALTLAEDLGVLIAYDDRLLAAASAHGLPTRRPA